MCGQAWKTGSSDDQSQLEWLYRLIRQPWRIKRMAVLPVFVFTVLRERQLGEVGHG